MAELIYPDERYRIVGAGFAVYKEKGCGFLEPVYQECLAMELELQGIPFRAQTRVNLSYKGRPLQQVHIPDFICFDKIVVELKAVEKLADEHRAQRLKYLHATGMRLGLLINFGHYPGIEHERIALSR